MELNKQQQQQQQQQQVTKISSQFESSTKSDSKTQPQPYPVIKKNKKLKNQKKLADLVANTFGPDSIDFFKSTINAAAVAESAVAAHATQALHGNKNYSANYSGNLSEELAELMAVEPVEISTVDKKSSGALASNTKTTKKLNKKFNLLQKKITSLIQSNNLESITLTSKKSAGTVNTNNIDLNSFKNLHIDDDEVSEV